MNKVSEQEIWQCVKENGDLQAVLDTAEPETRRWIVDTAHSLLMRRDDLYMIMKTTFSKLYERTLESGDFTEIANEFKYPMKDAMFLLYDGRDIVSLVWESLEPPIEVEVVD